MRCWILHCSVNKIFLLVKKLAFLISYSGNLHSILNAINFFLKLDLLRFVSGTRLEVKGARNYTSHPLYVGTDEIFEDIVIRGIRSDGFSSKFGVKNNKTSISKVH